LESILGGRRGGFEVLRGPFLGGGHSGNPGQTNYAAANRMMSALLRYLHQKNSAIRFKV